MYLSPMNRELVSISLTGDGEFTVYTDGTVKLPDGRGKDINDLLDEPIIIDNRPGNVVQVIGSVMYVSCLKKDQHVIADMLDSDDGDPAYHSVAFIIAIDWNSWERVWDRDIGLGGLTAMSVSDDAVYVAGFREYTNKDTCRTIVAKIDHAGELIWMQEIDAAATPHPTEIDISPDGLTVFVDSFNTFKGNMIRFKIDLDVSGVLYDIKTL